MITRVIEQSWVKTKLWVQKTLRSDRRYIRTFIISQTWTEQNTVDGR